MEGNWNIRATLRPDSPELSLSTPADLDADASDHVIHNADADLKEAIRDSHAIINAVPPRALTTDHSSRSDLDPEFPCVTVSYATAKRTLDLIIASTLLIALTPLMVIIALAVKLTSRGPIIFKQVRMGRGGCRFWCYKFRSMCADAEQKRHDLLHLNEASGPVFKIKQDPRFTPIGAFPRKFSLDELPQLFNVIRGDMSLVGPRPPLPSEVANYNARQRGRLAVQPGLTCLWQVNGRSNIGFDRWVELDLLYIETMSFRNDLKILLKTIPAVITGNGAH